MKLEFSGQTFEKYSNIKFNKNPFSVSRVPCVRTDRRDGANSRLSQFCGSTQILLLFFKYGPSRFMHFFASLYNFLPLLRDIFRSTVQLPCNLNLNFCRGLEMLVFGETGNSQFPDYKNIFLGGGTATF